MAMLDPYRASGHAPMGPAVPWQPARLAPMMTVPQFPGVPQHDGTITSLLAMLRQQAGGAARGPTTGEPRPRIRSRTNPRIGHDGEPRGGGGGGNR